MIPKVALILVSFVSSIVVNYYYPIVNEEPLVQKVLK